MLSLRSSVPVITEPLPIPRLCLIGKVPPRGTTVDLSHIEVVPNMNMWPLFHNGVAAGLRIALTAPNIDSTWIVYNKPKVGHCSISNFHSKNKFLLIVAHCFCSTLREEVKCLLSMQAF